MANILFLVHRLPYPPNKGDKLRSYHLLKHLAARHRVFLGTFVDQIEDRQYVELLRGLCAGLHAVNLHPLKSRLASLRGLLTQEALSLPYYRDASMSRWVEGIAATEALDAVVLFSSPMAQYALLLPGLPMLVDFVDVDSAKWAAYAPARAWPLSWLYRREGRLLLAFEQAVAERAQCSFFVTDQEQALFRELSPGNKARLATLGNGVDCAYFAPAAAHHSPYAAGQLPLVFSGAMDYWPNADAVIWFVSEVLPALRSHFPALHFHIVGRSPGPAVQALNGPGVTVSGAVVDVRPYLQHAAAVVAPLRLARGVQNKILEAMAMARPVVASAACVSAIAAQEGKELLAAQHAADFVGQLKTLLADPVLAGRIGVAARAVVADAYDWSANLAGIDSHLENCRPLQPISGGAA
jgi:polysaccharide biosynthesis protein PslH